MIDPGAVFLAINLDLSALSLLVILPIGVIIWLMTKLLYYSVYKGGRQKVLAVTACIIVSLAGLGYGLWRTFTDFSLIWFFTAVGGGIALILSLRSAALDKDDIKRE